MTKMAAMPIFLWMALYGLLLSVTLLNLYQISNLESAVRMDDSFLALQI